MEGGCRPESIEPLAKDWRGDGRVVEAPLRPQEGLGCCEKILFGSSGEKEHRTKFERKNQNTWYIGKNALILHTKSRSDEER
jgi:hypothetical protein